MLINSTGCQWNPLTSSVKFWVLLEFKRSAFVRCSNLGLWKDLSCFLFSFTFSQGTKMNCMSFPPFLFCNSILLALPLPKGYFICPAKCCKMSALHPRQSIISDTCSVFLSLLLSVISLIGNTTHQVSSTDCL